MEDEKIFYVGHTLSMLNGLADTSDEAKRIGANFFQIFLTKPTIPWPTRHKKQNILNLKKKLEINKQKMVIHGSFMTNFCNPINDKKHINAVKLVVSDMINAHDINALGVIIHMGKKLKMDESIAYDNYVKGIKTVLSTTKKGILILETGAGCGTEICSDIMELANLYKSFTKEERNRIKYCIDTCHIFSSGHNINDPEYCKLFCDIITKYLGWKNIACIHLNDSKCDIGSKKDRHADIGTGYISCDALKYIVKKCYENDVPVVLETPCDIIPCEEQIAIVKSWIYI